MDFLPKQYEVPESPSDYMKFVKGANTFRVLSSAVVGYVYFNKDNKPKRSKEQFDSEPGDMKPDGKVKHFWAFTVWNYQAKRVQILELTQKSVMEVMKANVDNPKWGNPKDYDVTVTRSGDGLDTEYVTQAEPHTALAEEIMNAYMNKKVNLEALFSGEDAFKS